MDYSFNFKTQEDLEALLTDFRILFAYNSNKIENPQTNYHHTRDIFENGTVVSYTGDLKTLFEISNQKDCYQFLLSKIINKEPLSISLIHKIHYNLTKGTYDEIRYNKNQERPGSFKKHDYVVGIHEVGSKPENVEDDMNELINEINEYAGNNYMMVVAYFHAVFECIHPYADGNGRVGRTLINYYLLTHNIAPLIIYDEDKQLYYECLEKYEIEEDLEPLKAFLEYEQEKTWSHQNFHHSKKLNEY